jgi:hybrid cluster-associated redox disulfide protein
MKQITKDMTIFEALKINPACEEVLLSVGMHCIGCALSRGETVEEAAAVHNVEADELVKRMNEAK